MKRHFTTPDRFDVLIRAAKSESELDQAVREMWQANSEGRLSDAGAKQSDAAASARRNDLKKIARQQATFTMPRRSGPGAGPRLHSRLPLSAPSQSLIRVPAWIGGTREFLNAKQATTAFYLRREVWREQVTRNNNRGLSKLDLRTAWEISFGLNSDPMDRRFGQCFASLTTFARTLGCRQQSFLDSARRLEDFDHLRILHGRGRGKPNRYEPVIDDRRAIGTMLPQTVDPGGVSAVRQCS